MGKEAKIGVAVIMILLITFGVVLARRLGGPDSTETTAASTNEDQGEPKPKQVSAPKDSGSETAAAGSSKPTVVEPNVASGKTPTPSPGAERQWSPISIGDQANQSADAGTADAGIAGPLPPSYMPNPQEPAAVVPDGRYASELPTPASQTWHDGDGRYDPLQSRAQQAPLGAGPAGPSPNSLRVLPAPAPSYQQSSRYTYPPPPVPPPASNPAQSVTVSDVPRGGDLKYDAQDLRNKDGEYEVQPNDSFWTISDKLYGTGAYFKALAEHNRDRISDGDRLRLGDAILAPNLSELEKGYPGLCPKPSRGKLLRNRMATVSVRNPYSTTGRAYVVEEGDTLYDIARWELGKASRWTEIHKLNRDRLGDDYDYLVPGTELVLPAAAEEPADAITSRPDNGALYK